MLLEFIEIAQYICGLVVIHEVYFLFICVKQMKQFSSFLMIRNI